MTECRDWLSTLWPASFKGVPFYFEQDSEEGGRGLVVHQFPMRDAPFVEDLGEEARTFAGTAYVHGDDTDAKAAAVMAALASRGAGTLVLPLLGPVIAHAQTFSRRHARDRLGYCAFEVKFVRDGESSAVVSVGLTANLAYGAADAAALVIARSSLAALAQGLDTIAGGVGALDAIRESRAVAPLASALLRNRATDLVQNIEAVAFPDDAEPAALGVVGLARDIAQELEPAVAAAAMEDLIEAFPPAAPDGPPRLVRLAALTAFSEALVRRNYEARPDGVAARRRVVARFEAELSLLVGADDADLYRALLDLRGRTVEHLSRTIADLAPVVIVEAQRSLPSLWWAWRLYGDPLRAGEIVARNRVRHPSFVPRAFEALAH